MWNILRPVCACPTRTEWVNSNGWKLMSTHWNAACYCSRKQHIWVLFVRGPEGQVLLLSSAAKKNQWCGKKSCGCTQSKPYALFKWANVNISAVKSIQLRFGTWHPGTLHWAPHILLSRLLRNQAKHVHSFYFGEEEKKKTTRKFQKKKTQSVSEVNIFECQNVVVVVSITSIWTDSEWYCYWVSAVRRIGRHCGQQFNVKHRTAATETTTAGSAGAGAWGCAWILHQVSKTDGR